ncbi:MAG: hypothetical protein ACK5N4_10710 [Parabacteroides gordonii]|uniref:hypothetical protein n=1 Tax=Parabacteroides gordonii TaxID=574930 RepID=UPI003A89BD63
MGDTFYFPVWQFTVCSAKTGYLGTLSTDEAPMNESIGACFCLFSLFTEVEQKNFISLL